MSTIKVDTIATRTGSGNITASNTIVGNLTGNVTGNQSGGTVSATNITASGTITGNAGGSVSAPALGIITGGLGVNGIYSPAANSLGFVAGGAVRGRFTADGLTFGSDTAATNALDDYEEGSWTPFYTTANNNLTLNGNASTTSSMYTTQGGSYIKIGRKVICHLSIATNGVTSHGGSGNLWIGGLPFTTVTTSATEPRGVNGAMAGRFSSFTPDQLVLNGNTTTMQIRAGFESYPTRSNLDTGGAGNRNVIEALIVYSTA